MISALNKLDSTQALLLGFALAFFLTYIIIIVKINSHLEHERELNHQYRSKIVQNYEENQK